MAFPPHKHGHKADSKGKPSFAKSSDGPVAKKKSPNLDPLQGLKNALKASQVGDYAKKVAGSF